MDQPNKSNKKVALWYFGIIWALIIIIGSANDGADGFLGAVVGVPLFALTIMLVLKFWQWAFNRPRVDLSEAMREAEIEHRRHLEEYRNKPSK